ncbi:AP-4 complex accessory subunit RUSC1 isoform X1 [Pseudophryne corroboree]|uniref:AP-4 complex accessory subunit RUSC1 isoform X1 n=1 Tax=Pseudophryne corroboree TaxID=495146 RepID=UPI003081705A
MLASRNALMSNLNYVHLQHVSLGVHLSMRPEVMEAPINQDTSLKGVSGCHHQWKDNSEPVLVDANSNDPSVPCQCCEQHARQGDTLQYGLKDHTEAIMYDKCLSPNDLPLSPLSPSSPSTDSSSSSDFTLDDSPVSMYYKEYSQDALESPDQQPEIIPLDVDTEAPSSLQLQSSTSLLPQAACKTLVLDPSSPRHPENMNNNNTEPIAALDCNSESILDSNCNALVESQQLDQTSLSSSLTNIDTVVGPITQTNIERLDSTDANLAHVPHWPVDSDLLPGLSFTGNVSTETPKKTITSFHELAQKRRKSGGLLLPQLKKDRSDWLIVFSPDTEQPPVNELTVSAFHHGVLVPQTHSLPAGKEVTTFRELRYRNTLNKQSVHQGKVHSFCFGEMGPSEPSAAGNVSYLSWEQNGSPHLVTKEMVLEDPAVREIEYQKQDYQPRPNQAKSYQKPDANMQKADTAEVSGKVWSLSGHKISTFVDTLSTTTGRYDESTLKSELCSRPAKDIVSTKAGVWGRGMADGGDKRCQEVGASAFPASNLFIRLATNMRPLYPSYPFSPQSSAPAFPRFLPWYPSFPPRLSPVGAYSPPQRALLPLEITPDMSVLLSPMFPKNKSREKAPHCVAMTDTPDPDGERAPLMADASGNSVQQQKKGLLIAIGFSVEKIVSHFNTSRNQVQKTQLGDSRLSPTLGYLILNHLCPSLYALLGDGLKQYQKDVIVGRRRLSPWSLVETSSKTGPKSLQAVYSKVSSLQQLRDPQRRFNAFIYGLLNTKLLDVWVSHLHHTYAQLSVLFLPTGFLPLAETWPELYEELILTLQPLSALTFHIDLLFEHHHLQLQDVPSLQRVPGPGQTSHNWGIPSFQHLLDIGGWITHNLTGSAETATEPPSKGKPEDACSYNGSPTFHARDRPQERSVPGRDDLPESTAQHDDHRQCLLSPGASTTHGRDSSNNWWEHLNQASRMYLPSKTDSFSFANLKNLTTWGTSAAGHGQSVTTVEGRDVENSYSLDSQDTVSESQKQLYDCLNDSMKASDTGGSDKGPKLSNTSSERVQAARTLGDSREQRHGNEKRGTWLGQLFGASSSHSPDMEGRNVKSRRPSSWLPPNVNVWSLIRKPLKVEIISEEPETGQKSSRKPERSLRALCDHAAAGETQLSFKKGDILQLLGTVDEDWIQCRHGRDTGLVPVGYTSLIL